MIYYLISLYGIITRAAALSCAKYNTWRDGMRERESSVEEDPERCCKTKESLIHEKVLSIVVSVRVPETPAAHFDALTSLFSYHDIHRQLEGISCYLFVSQSLIIVP